MKRDWLKSICSMPFKSTVLFNSIDSVLGKFFGGYIICWHDLASELFKSQVEALSPSKPIPLEELVERHKKGKSTKGCFALTLDDGVGKTVRDISTLCESMGWPITFYIPTQYLDGEALPYQKIKIIEKYLPLGHFTIPNTNESDNNNTFTKRKLIQYFSDALYTKPIRKINTILDQFIEIQMGKEKTKLMLNTCPQPISWNEVEELSKNPIISFQSHGLSHTALISQNEDEIEGEMINSKEIIEQHTGQKVHSFCYPYGNENVIGKYASEIVSKHYDSAVTLIRGRLQGSNPYYLPRIDLYTGDSRSVTRLKSIVN